MKEIVKDIYSIKPSEKAVYDSSKYIIDTKSDNGLVLIDPGLYVDFFLELEEKGFDPKDIKHCLITHAHLDHYGACYELKRFNKDIQFYAHKLDAGQIEQKLDHELIRETYPRYDYEPVKISRRIKDDEILKFGQFKFTCIHTPGHTPGAVGYLLEINKLKILFGGDIGGLALKIFGGNIDDYLNSLQKVIDLNVAIICDGHEGAIKPVNELSDYIQGLMKFNKFLHIVIEENPSNIKVWCDLTLLAYEMAEYDYALDFCNYLLEIDPNNADANRLLRKIKKHNPSKIEFVKPILEKYSKNQ